MAKAPAEVVAEALKMHADGAARKDIAAWLGVSVSAVDGWVSLDRKRRRELAGMISPPGLKVRDDRPLTQAEQARVTALTMPWV